MSTINTDPCNRKLIARDMEPSKTEKSLKAYQEYVNISKVGCAKSYPDQYNLMKTSFKYSVMISFYRSYWKKVNTEVE